MPRKRSAKPTDRKKRNDKVYVLPSLMIHGQSRDKHWDYRHHVVPPLSASTAYRLDSAARGAKGFAEFGGPDAANERPIYIYDRLGEPTRDMLEESLATAERTDIAVTFASGMAAVAAALGVCAQAGHHIVAHRVLYGSTFSLLHAWLPRFGVNSTLADLKNAAAIRKAIRPSTRVVYFETPANPNLELIEFAVVRAAVDAANRSRREAEHIHIVVDNTFATPFCQRPIEQGVDLVVHSLTKNVCGFGTDMGGAVAGAKKFLTPLLSYRKDFGGVLSPKAAWPILVYGLSTLALRVRKQEETAQAVAEYLERHPAVARVAYPGLKSFPQHTLARRQMTDFNGNFAPGSLVYCVLKGSGAAGQRRAAKLIDRLARDSYCITLAVSLGQVRTLIEHPSSMTHSMVPLKEQVEEGIDPAGVRLSIGLEDPADIIGDLERALKAIR
jgi:methionine-gamma-lyase